MPKPLLSVRISSDLDQLLQQKEAETGKNRSELTIEALSSFLRPPSPEDELIQIKQRLELLERKVNGSYVVS